MRQQIAVLESMRNAGSRHGVPRRTGDAPAGEQHRAAGRTVDTADAIQHAGLACPIGPDQREKLSGLDPEGYSVEYLQPAESEPHVAQLELSHTSGASGGIA